MKSLHFRVPKTVERFGRIFEEAGFSCYLVGGAVRNMVLHRKPTDYDFAGDADPGQVIQLFKRVIPTGIKHGTVTVLFEGQRFEYTTFRVESSYSDSRHPDSITFTPSIEEDLSRRDFTINSMAVKIPGGALLDPFGGREDLKRAIIRTVGPPETRIEEDALRMVRGCRFSAQLEFDLDEKLVAAMRRDAARIGLVSAERIREELEKIMKTDLPSKGFLEMENCGLLPNILPELSACRGIIQGDFHSFDVLDHSLYCCDGAPKDRPEVRFAALFHDLGKAETADERSLALVSGDSAEYPTFHGHEKASEQITHKICRRLRFSKASEERICRLVRHHMFNYNEQWSDAAVRRFIARVGKDLIDDLFALRTADTFGMRRRPGSGAPLIELKRRIEGVISAEQALSAHDLAVDGHLLEEAGIPKGPDMGTVIDQLLEAVLDDPEMNTKERLLTLARSFYAHHLKT